MLNPNAKPFEFRKHPKHPPSFFSNKAVITPPFLNSPRYLVCPLCHHHHYPHKHPKNLTGVFVWKNVSSVTYWKRVHFHAPPCRKRNSVSWTWRPKTTGTMNHKAEYKIKSSSPYDLDEGKAPLKCKPACSVNLIWRPKTVRPMNEEAVKTKSSSQSHSYDFDEYEAQLKCKTTIMFKNIPNRLSKNVLLGYLDKHCAQENEKLKKTEDSVESAYDFLYLPMDFKSGYNLGYAFVNFTSVTAAVRFFRAYHDFKWGVVQHSSSKVCEIKYAKIQGRDNLESHFRKSMFRCNTLDYLPIVFTPPRNGANSTETEASVIGTLSVPRRKIY